jgi:DNA-binding HxlR family transcriptional regulator
VRRRLRTRRTRWYCSAARWSSTRVTAGCPIEHALLVLDGKWSTLIIRELLSGPKRFGQLRTALAIGSPKTLTERLRILEHQGVLTRTVHAEVPPRVVYALTDRGRRFRSVLEAMAAWGEADLKLSGEAV